MKTKLSQIQKFWIGQLLVICWSVLAPMGLAASISFLGLGPQAALAQNSDKPPQGWESYLERPDILKIPGRAQNLPKNWEVMKSAHFSFVAQLLATYPEDFHLYFLARDSELLYDTARLVTQGTPDAERVHLINVSRANMRAPYIMEYLKENGISETTLKAGRKVLFVDTGFSGTIPDVIAESFPIALKGNIKTHLIVSSNSAHPSSRTFLRFLNPLVNEMEPSEMHGTIVEYEHMPRFSDRSTEFRYIQGRWHPISPIPTDRGVDGVVSKEVALQLMSDLKAEWEKPEVQEKFYQEKSQILALKKMLQASTEDAADEFKKLLMESDRRGPDQRIRLEAHIRDLFDSQYNAGFRIKLTFPRIGLSENRSSAFKNLLGDSKKSILIKKNPEWAPVLEDPETEIPKIFAEKNWQLIGNLIDAQIDKEFDTLLAKQLYRHLGSGPLKDLQLRFIEKTSEWMRWNLATFYFANVSMNGVTTEILKKLIEKGDTKTRTALAIGVFGKPQLALKHKDALRMLIEVGDITAHVKIAENVLSKPVVKDMEDLVRLLIEKGNKDVHERLATYVFSSPQAKDMREALRMLIEKGNQDVLSRLAQHTFSKPHTREMDDLLQRVIEKASPGVLVALSEMTFTRPHASGKIELLRMVVEKGNDKLYQPLKLSLGKEPHMSTEAHKVLRRALDINDSSERKQFLDQELGQMGPGLAPSCSNVFN